MARSSKKWGISIGSTASASFLTAWTPCGCSIVRGSRVIVATNQAGIARGFFDEAFVEATHQSLAATLAAGGARIDGFYFCPHHPDGLVGPYRQSCECRKPQSGLLRRAASDHQIDLQQSFVVGDRAHDIAAGSSVECTRRARPDRLRRHTPSAPITVPLRSPTISWALFPGSFNNRDRTPFSSHVD